MINWDEAPIDATHGHENPDNWYGPWRKIEGNKVYYFQGDEWKERTGLTTIENYFRANPEVVPRPAPVEAELPNGKVWPEGMTYFNPKIGDLFFNEKTYIYNGNVRALWMVGQFEAWAEFDDTIKRFPGGQPKVVLKEEPPKRRAVGWWV